MKTLAIDIDPDAVARFCKERGIRRLSLFGSAIRDDFEPVRSDVDVLVEFLPDRHPGLNFFQYERELADLLHQKIELHTPGFLSKYFREEVMAEAVPVYEQT
jgi:uncharacterized protein